MQIEIRWTDPHTNQTGEHTGRAPISLGRSANNTIVLSNSCISRNHAVIDVEGDQITIRDLNSSNGVMVHGQLLKNAHTSLTNSDTFTILPFEFTVNVIEDAKDEAKQPTVQLTLPSPLDVLSVQDSIIVQSAMQHLHFPAGTILFRQGDATDGCYLLDRGVIRLELEHEGSNPDDTDEALAFVEPNSFLGEISLMDRSTRSATAIAATDIDVRKISVDGYEKMQREHPAIAHALLMALARAAAIRLRNTTNQLDSLISARHNPRVESIIADAEAAQQELLTWSEERIDALLTNLAHTFLSRAEEFARLAVEETGMGNVADKTMKNHLASMAVLQAVIGKPGYGVIREDSDVIEVAHPVGIVFGLIPVTNPTSTFIFKTLITLKSRNALVANLSRRAVNVCTKVGEMIREVLREHGAPENLVQWVDARKNRKLTITLMSHRKIGMVLATGGSAMVKAAYSSGRPAIGVGSGNAPALITDTADVAHVARSVALSKTFDNGLICGAEHNLVVDARVVDACLDAMIEEGAAVLTPAEAEIFLQNSIDLKTGGFKEELVGKDAATIAAAYGIERPYPIRLIIVATDDSSANNPLACEKLLPVLSLFTYESLDSAIGLCQQLLSNDGRGHTAVIHTQDEQVMRRFAIAMPASRILVNSPSAHGTIGVCTPLLPSLTLGCGTFGGTSTTDNVTYTHLMNIKRVARFVPEKLAQLVQA